MADRTVGRCAAPGNFEAGGPRRMLSEPRAFGAHGEPAAAVVHQAEHLVHPARRCDRHPAAAAVEADDEHVRFRRRETGGRDQARIRLVKAGTAPHRRRRVDAAKGGDSARHAGHRREPPCKRAEVRRVGDLVVQGLGQARAPNVVVAANLNPPDRGSDPATRREPGGNAGEHHVACQHTRRTRDRERRSLPRCARRHQPRVVG